MSRLNRRGFLQQSAAFGSLGLNSLGLNRLGLSGLGLSSLAWWSATGTAHATLQAANPETTAAEMIAPAQTAITKGLRYLANHQLPEGSFGSAGSGYSRNAAVCGLGGLAFVASGSTPQRGPFGEHVENCIRFLLANARDDGFLCIPGATSHGPMYDHGFATLFLAECYGMTQRTELRDKLDAAVRLILEAQNPEGGWRYQPRPDDADLSVTICQVMALRAARNAGIFVPREYIDRCTDYVKRCQNADGGFMYMAHGGQSAFPRSAAGVVALYMAGIYEGEEIDRGLEYLMTFLPTRHGGPHRESHYFYGHYYAVQAMWYAGGQRWNTWYPAIRDELISLQREDGAWLDPISYEYGTAMACIILQLPNNFLPIIQR